MNEDHRGVSITRERTFDNGSFFSGGLVDKYDLFIIGCIANKIYTKYTKPCSPIYSIFFLLIAGALTWWELGIPVQSLLWAIANNLLAVAWAGLVISYLRCSKEVFFSKLFSLIGRVSFSIYCWQYFIYYAIINSIPKNLIGGYQIALLVFLFVLLPFSIASYYLIEKPFLEKKMIEVLKKI